MPALPHRPTPAMLAANVFFPSSPESFAYMTFCAWGEPAPCMDSTRAVPPVMFSSSRPTRIRSSVGIPAAPWRYFST